MKRLLRDRRGVATTEFALWMTLVFFSMLGAFDIGRFVIERGRLAEAVSTASLAAFKSRDNVDFSALPGYLRAASGISDPSRMTVSVGCNGGQANCVNTNRTCACLSRAGVLTSVSQCNVACGSNATASSRSGYYMRVEASYTYRPLILPNGLMKDAVVRQNATVRLK